MVEAGPEIEPGCMLRGIVQPLALPYGMEVLHLHFDRFSHGILSELH
jgi:hypothetical protein